MENNFLECDIWAVKKLELETNIGQITPENIIRLMLKNVDMWSEINQYEK